MKKAKIARFVSAAFMALMLAATALAYTPKVTDDGNYNNKNGPAVENTQANPAQPENNTGITNQTVTVQRCTTAPITGATLAPDDNTGITNNTMAGNHNSMTFREAARFKDVMTMDNGTPPERIMTATATAAKNGVPPDNVQVATTNQKTDDGFNVGTPTDQASMAAAFQAIQVANQIMAGITGSNVARHYGGMEAANAPYDGFGTVAGTATQIV